MLFSGRIALLPTAHGDVGSPCWLLSPPFACAALPSAHALSAPSRRAARVLPAIPLNGWAPLWSWRVRCRAPAPCRPEHRVRATGRTNSGIPTTGALLATSHDTAGWRGESGAERRHGHRRGRRGSRGCSRPLDPRRERPTSSSVSPCLSQPGKRSRRRWRLPASQTSHRSSLGPCRSGRT